MNEKSPLLSLSAHKPCGMIGKLAEQQCLHAVQRTIAMAWQTTPPDGLLGIYLSSPDDMKIEILSHEDLLKMRAGHIGRLNATES